MTGRTKWSTLRDELVAKPGAKEAIASARAQSLEEIRLYELRHAEAVSQVEMAGRLEVTQGAISKFEHADDVRVSTLREYLEALGARLELVAVFDEEERRVPVHLGAAVKSGSGQQGESSTGSSTGSIRTSPDKATRASTSKSKKRSSEPRTSTKANRRSRRSDHS